MTGCIPLLLRPFSKVKDSQFDAAAYLNRTCPRPNKYHPLLQEASSLTRGYQHTIVNSELSLPEAQASLSCTAAAWILYTRASWGSP